MHQYQSMCALFEAEPEAKRYFDELPDYVQGQISTRANGVNSFESLWHYADNLLRGDG